MHLIRHARPAIDPAVRPSDWSLAAESEGIAALRDSRVLPTPARWFSSPEPKAQQTARLLVDGTVEVVNSLREAARDSWFEDPTELDRAVEDYLVKGTVPDGAGWEPRVDVALRIVDTALGVLAAFPDEDSVLVGHGIAFTLLVGALTGTPPDVAAWRSLRMPDHCALALRAEDAFEVVSPWGAWAAG
nr:histidine phosphatase family protein [Microlunatus panaciterrae]